MKLKWVLNFLFFLLPGLLCFVSGRGWKLNVLMAFSLTLIFFILKRALKRTHTHTENVKDEKVKTIERFSVEFCIFRSFGSNGEQANTLKKGILFHKILENKILFLFKVDASVRIFVVCVRKLGVVWKERERQGLFFLFTKLTQHKKTHTKLFVLFFLEETSEKPARSCLKIKVFCLSGFPFKDFLLVFCWTNNAFSKNCYYFAF